MSFPFFTLLRAGVDLILPPRCPATGEVVAEAGTVSPALWKELDFITAPFCAACGLPFSFEMGGAEALCGACLEHRPVFDCARSPLVYNDASRTLILALKYGDRMDVALTLSPMMARAGAELIAESDAVVPVPLHPWRLWSRRFNQSAVLGKRLAAQTGLSFRPDLLSRTRRTIPQKGLSRAERQRNVRGAFSIPKNADVHGMRILLIDDVLTSGATLDECARILKKAGAAHVAVLTAARVTREGAD